MPVIRDEIVAEVEDKRAQLNQRLLDVYNLYRVLVGLTLLIVFSQGLFDTQLGSLNPESFWWLVIAYTSANIAITLFVRITPRFPNLLLALGAADIAWLSVLMYMSGGISSGLAPLILAVVAVCAILLEGRTATFVAAIASLAVLYEELHVGLVSRQGQFDLFQAGVYGLLYFGASLTIQRLSRRVRQNEMQALTQAAEVADLERLNRQIIQRMRTGIIVVDGEDRLRMYNQSSRLLLGSEITSELTELPPKLAEALRAWRKNTSNRSVPFQVSVDSPEIRVNFSAIRLGHPEADVTIFIEDTSDVQQQAQNLKLAELGQLSASIAHEIRNPLGAISHAAQLLNESEALVAADQRLAEMIINHSRRMNGVVENVLEMSRRRPPEPRRINLAEFADEFETSIEQSFADASVEFHIDPPDTTVRMDRQHLEQALTNLIDNALRYSDANDRGRTARIDGGIDERTERPFLNVIDFGQGVPDEVVPNLFQPFKTTAVGGTGLGLYITKELCDANQAQLTYFRHGEGGSCFRVLFAHPDRITS